MGTAQISLEGAGEASRLSRITDRLHPFPACSQPSMPLTSQSSLYLKLAQYQQTRAEEEARPPTATWRPAKQQLRAYLAGGGPHHGGR